jgi:hypothetical protein
MLLATSRNQDWHPRWLDGRIPHFAGPQASQSENCFVQCPGPLPDPWHRQTQTAELLFVYADPKTENESAAAHAVDIRGHACQFGSAPIQNTIDEHAQSQRARERHKTSQGCPAASHMKRMIESPVGVKPKGLNALHELDKAGPN